MKQIMYLLMLLPFLSYGKELPLHNPEKDLYEQTVPGVPVPGGSLGGLYKKVQPVKPMTTAEIKAVQRATMMARGNEKLSLGITVGVAGLLVSMCVANVIVQKMGNVATIAGAVWSLSGIVLIGLAVYWHYVFWGCAVAAVVAIFVFKKRGFDNVVKAWWGKRFTGQVGPPEVQATTPRG